MIEYTKYHWSQYKNKQTLKKILSAYDKEMENARAEGTTPDEVHEIGADAYFENKQIEEEILLQASKYYVRLAVRMQIPIPECNEDNNQWVASDTEPNHYYLSIEALYNLRRAVRIERKERREGWFIWLAALTGLIGTITGLIAVWKD